MTHSRRSILKGMSLGAGSFLLGPLLSQIEAHAEGNIGAMPSRFVFVVKDSGIWPSGITPAEFMANGSKPINASLVNATLPSSMAPLRPFQNQVSIVQGLSGKMCRGGHTSHFGMMGVYMVGSEVNPGNPLRATADAELAKLHPAPFNHVALAVRGDWGSNNYGGVMYPGISAVGPGKELPFQGSPDVAFDQLFGSAVSASKDGERRFKLQKNLLDFMVDDIKKVERSIPSAEKMKMDAYLNAFEELQTRHSKLVGMKDNLKGNAPKPPQIVAANDALLMGLIIGRRLTLIGGAGGGLDGHEVVKAVGDDGSSGNFDVIDIKGFVDERGGHGANNAKAHRLSAWRDEIGAIGAGEGAGDGGEVGDFEIAGRLSDGRGDFDGLHCFGASQNRCRRAKFVHCAGGRSAA